MCFRIITVIRSQSSHIGAKILNKPFNELTPVFNKMSKHDLTQANSVDLMDRVDSKFIFLASELHEILNQCMESYSLVILAETNLFATDKHVVKINWEKIENISPEKKKELFEDLSKRTGLSVCEVKGVDIDFLNDTANIEVYYKDSKN